MFKLKVKLAYEGCIECGRGEINFPIWIEPHYYNGPASCYCERVSSEPPCKLKCEASYTMYRCKRCNTPKDKRSRLIRLDLED